MNRLRVRVAVGSLFIVLLAGWVSSAAPVRILFLHHSTGGNLVRDGAVREGFEALGHEFWDHGYNEEGLTDARGSVTGQDFGIPDDNTDPDGWAAVFSQPVTAPPSNAFSRMLEFDVILFKSCFPSSNITDAEMLANYEDTYLSIRDVVDLHPDRLFVAFTPPPLVPNETDPENAARAREWAGFLTSQQYLQGRANLVVFDFFALLSDPSGTLRPEYRSDEWDSHPNELANRAAGPLLVDFVQRAVVAWQAAGG